MKPRVALCRCADCRALDRAFPGQGRQLLLPATTKPKRGRQASRTRLSIEDNRA